MGTRALVLSQAPGAIESIYDAYSAVAISFSFTGRLKDSFCHVATYSKYVNLGFNRGALLADPEGALEGTGKLIRHIRIASAADLQQPFLKSYIRAAISQVPGPVKAEPQEKVQFRGNYPTKRRPG